VTVLDVTPPEVQCGTTPRMVDGRVTYVATGSDACGMTLALEGARCMRERGAKFIEVVAGCDLEVMQETLIQRSIPPADYGDIWLAYKVRGTDPSGNERVEDCSVHVGGSLSDRDNDTIPDIFDNCPDVFNPDQLDTDLDGIGDACDPEPFDGLWVGGGGGCEGGSAQAMGIALMVMLGLWRRSRQASGRA
jgi:hypothetical protein